MLKPKTKAEWQAEWKAKELLRKQFERIYTASLTAEFTRVGKEAAAGYVAHGHGGEESVIKDHKQRLHDLLMRLYLGVGLAFGHRAVHGLKSRNGAIVETKLTEDSLTAWITSYASKISAQKVTKISATTEERINAAITKGLSDPENTVQDVADLIESSTAGEIGPWRATLISRTETHTAGSAGDFAGAQSLGIDIKKFWIATDDDRTREDHRDVDTDPIPMHETFTVGEDELQFPGDPDGSAEEIINCRCVLGYADASEGN